MKINQNKFFIINEIKVYSLVEMKKLKQNSSSSFNFSSPGSSLVENILLTRARTFYNIVDSSYWRIMDVLFRFFMKGLSSLFRCFLVRLYSSASCSSLSGNRGTSSALAGLWRTSFAHSSGLTGFNLLFSLSSPRSHMLILFNFIMLPFLGVLRLSCSTWKNTLSSVHRSFRPMF